MSTAELDAVAESKVRAAGAEPAFKGYRGYPATLCASVNEQVVHGIRRRRSSWPATSCRSTWAIEAGRVLRRLRDYGAGGRGERRCEEPALRVTREALDKGIAQVKVGGRISDIGHAIQAHVEAHGFSVVREFVGHGIGASLHEEPQIANYGEPGRGPRMAEGMTLAIEPMVNMGKASVKVLADGWTAVTKDGSCGALSTPWRSPGTAARADGEAGASGPVNPMRASGAASPRTGGSGSPR